MNDVFHYYGNDLTASSTGDLLLADLPTTGTQRVYRRLLTNPQLNDAAGNPVAPGDYLSQPTYGAGLPRMIGAPQAIFTTKAIIKSQMFLESAVARSPAPQINLNQINNTLSAVITYTDANTASIQTVQFDINQ